MTDKETVFGILEKVFLSVLDKILIAKAQKRRCGQKQNQNGKNKKKNGKEPNLRCAARLQSVPRH